jgi:hypothetical protein
MDVGKEYKFSIKKLPTFCHCNEKTGISLDLDLELA